MTGAAHKHLGQLAVERFLLGELAGDARGRVEAAMAECPTCRARVAETEADDRAFALRPLPAAIRALADREAGAAARRRSSPWLFALPALGGAAAAIAIAVALWPGGPAPTPEAGLVPGIGSRAVDGAVREKGAATAEPTALNLGFYVSRAAGDGVGRPGERLAAGDRIQFWYDAPDAQPFVLVGIDGRGAVTTYFPAANGGERALRTGRGLSLGGAVELDDARGIERFFLCAGPTAADPLAVESAARALAAAGADLVKVERLPLGCAQASVWIRKE